MPMHFTKNTIRLCLLFILFLASPIEAVFAQATPTPSQQNIWVLTDHTLTPAQQTQLQTITNILIMIPGISSGDIPDNLQFLDKIIQVSGHDLAIFFDWETDTFTRKMAMSTTSNAGAENLVDLLSTIQSLQASPIPIDIIAHSLGSVVINKAAMLSTHQNAGITFRHVLFLGTALDTHESLEDLKHNSDAVLNVRSAYDKVNRNINHNLGLLYELNTAMYTNLQIDHSFSGRIMRHYTSLSASPETCLPYGRYLQTGVWPAAQPMAANTPYTPENLYQLCRNMRNSSSTAPDGLQRDIPQLLTHTNPDIQYFGLILAGLTDATNQIDVIRHIIQDPDTPAFIRKEAYQALGNFEDGHLILYLKRARKRDKDCQEEIRDILRELKRNRVERLR